MSERAKVGRPKTPEDRRRRSMGVSVSPETYAWYKAKSRGLAGHHLDEVCHDKRFCERGLEIQGGKR